MTGVLTREKTQRNETKTQRRQSRGRLEQRLELHSPSQGMPRVTEAVRLKEGFSPRAEPTGVLWDPLDFRHISRTMREYIFVVFRQQGCNFLKF